MPEVEVFAAEDTDYMAKLNSVSQKANSDRTDRLINGALRIWQRGTSFTPLASTVTYTADRFFAYRLTNANYTVSQVAGVGSRYGLKAQRTAADTAANPIYVGYVLESDEAIQLAGKTVTLSFDLKVGANFSGASNQVNAEIHRGLGIDQSAFAFMGDTWTSQAPILSPVFTGSTSFLRMSTSFTVPTGTTQIGIRFFYTPTGTAGADDSITLQNIAMADSAASTAPLVRHIAEDYTMCRRYCVALNAPVAGNNLYYPHMFYFDANNVEFGVHYETMRASPSVVFSGTANTDYGLFSSGGILSGFTWSTQNVTPSGLIVVANKTAHGLTSSANLAFGLVGNSPGKLILSAEL